MRLVCVYMNGTVRTGGQRRYLELAQQLGALGHDVVLLKSDALEYPLAGCRVLSLPFSPRRTLVLFSLRALGALKRARDAIRSFVPKADWVMIHGETHFFAGVWLTSLTGARLLFAYRNNTVFEAGVSLRENRRHLLKQASIAFAIFKYRLYERMIGRRADVLVFQSTFDQESYLSRNPSARGRCAIVPGNIGGPRFKAQHKDINRSVTLRRLAFVGGLGERKGIRYLVRAVEELVREGYDITLDVIGGDASLPRWQARLEQQGLGERIRLLGRQADPFPLIGQADLVVVPSLFDSYPDVVLEALHTGTPVIGSAVGGIPDILRHDELLFEARSPEAIRDKVAAMMSRPQLYQQARELCRARRESFYFDWARAFADLMPVQGGEAAGP